MESDLSEVVRLYALEQKAENKRRVGKIKEIRLENSFGRRNISEQHVWEV